MTPLQTTTTKSTGCVICSVVCRLGRGVRNTVLHNHNKNITLQTHGSCHFRINEKFENECLTWVAVFGKLYLNTLLDIKYPSLFIFELVMLMNITLRNVFFLSRLKLNKLNEVFFSQSEWNHFI